MTLTGSLSSPGGGAWLIVGMALPGEVVRGEDARGIAMVGPVKDQRQGSASGRPMIKFENITFGVQGLSTLKYITSLQKSQMQFFKFTFSH